MTLYDYDIRHGELLLLETWDGWGPLLHASLMDMPQKVHRCLMTEDDPMVARFQARVALSIAAHFGLTDLASKLVCSTTQFNHISLRHFSTFVFRSKTLLLSKVNQPHILIIF